MLFPTLDYLLFLPLVVAVYWLTPERYRIRTLVVASLFFYGSWNPGYLPLLLGVAAGAYFLGQWAQNTKPGKGRMGLGLFALFIPLIVFKYWDWLGFNIRTLSEWIGGDVGNLNLGLALPVGISFFTFQAVSYVIDARRDGNAEKDPARFLTFLAFFPQLVAGPIVRRHELMPQLKGKLSLEPGRVGNALYRITKGMAKKLLIADVMRAAIVDMTFADPGAYTGIEMWIALYAYTLQIYYDFSAYTDIAIGSALLFGIKLPENFNRPYQATSVAEFWRRWHITLSNWVRDYIYYPLGGAQMASTWKVYRNILVTMVAIGIWHGASWNFVFYGLLHGTAVCVCRWQRKRTGRKPGDPLPNRRAWFWRFMLTFHFVVLARILFRADDLMGAWEVFLGLWDFYWVLPRYAPFALFVLMAGYAIHFTPAHWEKKAAETFKGMLPVGQALVAAAAGALCWFLGTGETLSFVYYSF